jgi:dTDP-4-dehydrorhamnose reductase
MRVLLLGAGGQLGTQLAHRLGGSPSEEFDLTSFTRSELDLCDIDALRAAVRTGEPEVVINAAAYTAVDKAENEPELAGLVNAAAPGVIAEEVAKMNGWMIHYSTDYVFDGSGTTSWRENDPTGPLSVYGQTKLDGERAIAATGCRHVILRTSWVYAAEGRNFLHTVLRLGRERAELRIVDDQIGAPTTAEAITVASLAVLRQLATNDDARQSGVYHLACAGATSWYGFARAIFAAFASWQKAPEVLPIPTESYPTAAKRPLNSRLNCEKFETQFGFQMPAWEDAFEEIARALLARKRAGMA